MIESLYDIPEGCICQGDGLLGTASHAERHATLKVPIYTYSWGPRGNLPGAMDRKGQRCRLLVRGAFNSGLVEFEDGYRAVISRNALRRARL